jgi:hypothetical protein
MTLDVGDVVQIDPAMADSFFAGCFMFVTEVKSWGAQGFIAIPGDRDALPGRAYFRCKTEDMKRIGRAAWRGINPIHDTEPKEAP